MKIWITWATWFIWRSFIENLLKKENSNFSTFSRSNLLIKTDFSNSYVWNINYNDTQFRNFLGDIDVLIHLVDSFNEDIDYLFNEQLKINKIVFDLVKKSKIKKIIYFSSIAVYWEGYKKKENDLLLPTTNYGLTKMLSENVFNILRWYGKDVVILRPSNVYWKNSKKWVIYNFVNNIKKNNEILIYGEWTQQREFLYIDDCIEAMYKALDFNGSDIFNISSWITYSLVDILNILKKDFQRDFTTKFLPMDNNNPIQVLSEDISHTKDVLWWDPKTSILDWLSDLLWRKYM